MCSVVRYLMKLKMYPEAVSSQLYNTSACLARMNMCDLLCVHFASQGPHYKWEELRSCSLDILLNIHKSVL